MPAFRRSLAAASAVLAALSVQLLVAPAALALAPPIPAADADIQISEVESNGGTPGDWIELHNLNGSSSEDLTGWWLQDNDAGHRYDIAAGTVITTDGYLAFDVAASFGLGGADSARVYDASNNLVDHVDWTVHADDPITGGGSATPDATYSRCSGSHSESGWVVTDTDTKGAANSSCPATTAVDTEMQAALHVNEAMVSDPTGPDWIELANTGTISQDLSGWILSDDNSSHADHLPAAAVVDVGAHPWWAVGAATDIWGNGSGDFGLGSSGDNAALEFPDKSDTDRLKYGTDTGATVAAPAAGKTLGRCPDGSGAWQVTFTTSQGATNVCSNPADSQVVINEVDTATHTIELANTSASTADVSGLTLKDGAADTVTIPAATTIAVGGYAGIDVSAMSGLVAAGDTITLLDGSTTIDSTTWDHTLATSWGRCPDSSGSFADTAAATDGAANSCTVPPPSGYDAIRINEIETNGDPNGDWIELTNVSADAVNISGMILRDDNDGHTWAIPGTTTDPADTSTDGNTVLSGGGFSVFYSNTQFGFGLGGPDMARLFTPANVLVDSTAWAAHESGVTYERCPGAPAAATVFTDSFGDPFVNSWANSPGAVNDCLPPIRINEVQASDAAGGNDWVELTNVGNAPVDLTGYMLADDKDSDSYVIDGTNGDVASLAPGGFASYEVDAASHANHFGLGKSGDEVRLYETGSYSGGHYDNNDLVDSFVFEDTSGKSDTAARLPADVTLPNGTWPVNPDDATSPMTYARCFDGVSQVVADGTGAWAPTTSPTRDGANSCPGLITATPWPDTHNGQAVSTDDAGDVGQNMSGLFYVAGATPAEDYMWGIQNGSSGLSGASPGDPGSLYKLVPGDSGWGPASGWASGRPVRYLSGVGEPDSEGVTAVHGKVYVASERDNTDDTVSKIAVLEVNPDDVTAHSGDADGDLVASHEWDLGPVLGPGGTAGTGLDSGNPGDANLGPEGLAFVSDAYLVGAGFVDDTTGSAYDPSDYPGHVDSGVFFVAMEKTGKLYGFVLNADNTFTWISTVDTGFPTIQDVLWDPSQHALWATCDNSCQGRSSLITIDTDPGPDQGTFQPVTVYARPTGATQNLNNEGFTVQPASECVDGSKSAYWSDDTDDGGHWLRTASVDCTGPGEDQVGATVSAHVAGTSAGGGKYYAPVTVSFTCDDADAVLNDPCPDPVTVNATTPGYDVATLTDTLGLTHVASVPAITIAPPPAGGGPGGGGGSGPPSSPPPTLTVTGGTGGGSAVFGQPVTFTVTISPAGPGSLQWLLDGSAAGGPVTMGSFRIAAAPADSTSASFTPQSPLSVGSHVITAAFTPKGSASTASASFTEVVGKASTETAVTVSGDTLSAKVAPVAPGVGSPSGTVAFTIGGVPAGSAPVGGDGTATLAAAGVGDQPVAATYSGDADFLPSSGNRGAVGPHMVAHVSSAHGKRHGWYRSPVHVSFRCTAGSAALSAPCPGPVTLSASKAGQSVSVTVTGTDGGATTVTVSPINIDRVAPELSVAGAHSGRGAAHGRHLRCDASDTLSGIASCTIRTRRHHHDGVTEVRWTATATDRAGNVRVEHGRYRIG